ncbi:hypothetical protein KIL84_000916 [Mauremys mutica]|uniref:AP-5 complex subunit sigma-1 n=2 Tax=Mauremys mutica TaxID=74926 RepID=A0A9D3WZB1_9SAUR|nr:hypothetical protein KIL84_000916 [Mauremys mutica]
MRRARARGAGGEERGDECGRGAPGSCRPRAATGLHFPACTGAARAPRRRVPAWPERAWVRSVQQPLPCPGGSIMVHAFLIHTLHPRPGAEAGLCRVLYSRVFGSERLDQSPEEPGPHDLEKERLGRKEQILAVARQVDSTCKLLHQASGRPASDFPVQLPDEPISLQDAPSGVFRLPPGDPFCENKTVLWLGVLSLGFALVCDPQENLMLAENTLRLVVKYLLEHLKLLNQGSDVVLKADKTEIILSKFLPHGQLLFLNDQFVQGLEKELGACLSK